MAKRKQKKGSSQTRELLSDDLTQVETQTTGHHLYLESRPVKFVNLPAGGFFRLNGDTWQKIDASRGRHFIKIPGHEAAIAGGIANFSPGDFVFLMTDSEKPK